MQPKKFTTTLCADEGTLRIGPLKLTTLDEFRRTLAELGISTGADTSIRVVRSVEGWLHIAAAGPDVTGYFLEDFGIEAADESVEDFIRRACPANVPISVGGRHHPDDETRISTSMTAIHDGKTVSISQMRIRERDGEVLRLSRSSPCSIAIRSPRPANGVLAPKCDAGCGKI